MSKILNKEALFFQNILHQIRSASEYFRVGFYGYGFPLFVRNKQFVYRGLEYERIGTFTQRLQTEFPQAQVLTKNTPPDQSILLSTGQYLQINNVRPISNPVHLRTAAVPVPEHIASFYEVNDVSRFQYDRPIHKGTIDKDNEFKTLWIERTLLEVETPLPGILRWFEVTSRSMKELTPLEFACETMENVQKELTDLINQYKANNRLNINPFSMRLQGLIDANVMGGISKYQEAFFSEAFTKSEHGKAQSMFVQKLKSLILDQMQILDTALELHGMLAPEGVQPLHKRLMERFLQLKQSLAGIGKIKKQHSESIVNTPLPPLPFEKRAMSFGANSQSIYSQEEDVYIRPNEAMTFNYAALGTGNKNRESLMLPDITSCLPEKPLRPKSAGYNSFVSDGPDVPPKSLVKSPNAPPLPPRGCTPDKRQSNSMSSFNGELDQVPILPRRSQKYSVVDISLEESDINLNQALNEVSLVEFRDSGISGSTQELNMNRSSYEENSLREDNSNPEGVQAILNDISTQEDLITPPPIPIKTGLTIINGSDKSISPLPSYTVGDGYVTPKNGGKYEDDEPEEDLR